MASTTTSSAPSATATATSGNNVYSDGQSRPLLFFVALGFGVVFTNLWIIVGVKYCFRYNQRARQLAALEAEGGDGVDMGNLQRPRRRREKKLLSMEDVNARFPLIKYKLWRASREVQGLPAAGGVTAPPSRAASIKESMALDIPHTEQRQSAEAPRKSANFQERYEGSSTESHDFAATSASASSGQDLSEKRAGDIETPEREGDAPEDDEEDDPIRTAVPAGLLADPGDACAICLDTLEDDDEVRGLTCGHAFHAGCLDPWLTGRRACCPLCKADYYIPKPRPENENAQSGDGASRRERMTGPLSLPTNVWMHGRGIYRAPGRMVVGGTGLVVEHDRGGFPHLMRDPRLHPHWRDRHQTNPSEDGGAQQPRTSRLRGAFSSLYTRNARRPEGNEAAVVPQPEPEPDTTPGQLEAGER